MTEFHIGDKVRNIKTGNVGTIIEFPYNQTYGKPWCRVRIIQYNGVKSLRAWNLENIEIVNEYEN